MKKTILTLIVAALTVPALAQYDGEGFYRIKNMGTAKRYISIANNKVEKKCQRNKLTGWCSSGDLCMVAQNGKRTCQ
jgi:hypothetical protein